MGYVWLLLLVAATCIATIICTRPHDGLYCLLLWVANAFFIGLLVTEIRRPEELHLLGCAKHRPTQFIPKDRQFRINARKAKLGACLGVATAVSPFWLVCLFEWRVGYASLPNNWHAVLFPIVATLPVLSLLTLCATRRVTMSATAVTGSVENNFSRAERERQTISSLSDPALETITPGREPWH